MIYSKCQHKHGIHPMFNMLRTLTLWEGGWTNLNFISNFSGLMSKMIDHTSPWTCCDHLTPAWLLSPEWLLSQLPESGIWIPFSSKNFINFSKTRDAVDREAIEESETRSRYLHHHTHLTTMKRREIILSNQDEETVKEIVSLSEFEIDTSCNTICEPYILPGGLYIFGALVCSFTGWIYVHWVIHPAIGISEGQLRI